MDLVITYTKSDISYCGKIGNGSFGIVFEGALKVNESEFQKIAIKVPNGKWVDKDNLMNELKLLSKLKHPNVVHFFGVFEDNLDINLLFEFLNGDARKFVREQDPTHEMLLRISHDISEGMDYIHVQNIIHRDLAARNVLLDSKNTAKIADFGLSRLIDRNAKYHYSVKLSSVFPLRWMPKESLPKDGVNGIFNKHSDVWSFGVTIWEIWNKAEIPYTNLNDDEVKYAIRSEQNPMTFQMPEGTPPVIVQLLEDIFVQEDLRPNFSDIKIFLNNTKKGRMNLNFNVKKISYQNETNDEIGDQNSSSNSDQFYSAESIISKYDENLAKESKSSGIKDGSNMDLNGITFHSAKEVGINEISAKKRLQVRECLEKDPTERSEYDLQVLLEFTQHLQAFNDLTPHLRKGLVGVMVFALVEKAGTIVLCDGEELDSWCVVITGTVEVDSIEGKSCILNPGDSFGFHPTPNLSKQYFRGQMRTRTDGCQFVCVAQEDYFRILNQGQDKQIIIQKDGQTILVSEQRSDSISQQQFVSIIRGSNEELMNQLVFMENTSGDPTYVEDYLLTQRIFEDNQTKLIDKLITWFSMASDPISQLRDKVIRVILLWVNNHFVDFDADAKLFSFLVRFQQLLEKQPDMQGQLRLLQIACSAKSLVRKVTIARKSRDDPLPFNIIGGGEEGYGLFISYNNEECNGLRIGDEIIEINGEKFKDLALTDAFEKIKTCTHIALSVKCNFIGYHECLNSSFLPNATQSTYSQFGWSSSKNAAFEWYRRNQFHGFKKVLAKMHLLPKKSINDNSINDCMDVFDEYDYPEYVVKIYRPDQSFKYLLINKETTTKEVIVLFLAEFGENEGNYRDYSLFQVSANNEILKQTRLPDNFDSLAERIQLGARYYVKKQESTEQNISVQILSDDQLGELMKECEVNFLNLNPIELALQLTLEDYALFKKIEVTEYVNDIFGLDSLNKSPNLEKFTHLVNKETFWVVGEVTKEPNIQKRAQIIKRFIKVATICKECRNFNSMFAIISGLGHFCVSRLKQTWEKVGDKYMRQLSGMQALMDPSRNMGKYRDLLAKFQGQTPVIPFYTLVQKDLIFIHLKNSTMIENLVNFEKMRMVAKEIRNLNEMCAAKFDNCTQPSIALLNHFFDLRPSTRKDSIKSKIPNPKKMYNEAIMVKKVLTYLAKLVVNEDEDLLLKWSFQCEA